MKGGIAIGGINPNLKSPRADVWSAILERKFNIFNRANLGFVDADPLDPNFGKVTSQQLPRWWDVAVRLTF